MMSKEERKRTADEEFALGLKYYGGIDCDIDRAEAEKHFDSALHAGKTKSLYWLGLCASERGDFKSAEKYFKKGADKGDTDALRQLGLLYRDSLGDAKRAAKTFKRGAKRGDAGSIYYFALAVRDGVGTEKDEAKAFDLFCSGAEKGDVGCLTEKGRALLHGCGTQKDIEKAKESLIVAVERGDLTALALLGEAEKDLGKIMKAAEREDPEGIFLLAKAYLYGNKVAKNRAKAEVFLVKAASLGHKEAILLLKSLRDDRPA